MTQALAGGQWQTYTYDGSGQRIRRNVSGAETWQVYGLGGELLAEYSANDPATTPQKEYGYRNGQLLIVAGTGAATAPAPSSLVAAPSSGGGNVVLTWSAASGAANYRVERKGATGSFVLAGTTGSTGLTDTGASAGSAYLYRVCAANAQGTCTSVFSNIALGAAVGFPTDPTITSIADDPTGVNVTKVKVAHITELRTAVNAVRTLAGKPGAQWINQALNATVTFISADDVRDLRANLDEALLALGIQTSNYDDQTLAGAPNGTVIKKVHITQLRQRSTSGTGGAGGSSPNQFGVQWLVTDQLGTPRMVFDETGSLSNVKRHDYLPFGEDLVAGARATTPGYGAADGVRQKFTGYEHDDETKLEFAHARYYASTQGRFSGVDPMSGQVNDPQSWNRYAYVGNNPVNLTDPTGMNYFVGGGVNDPEIYQDGFNMGPMGTASNIESMANMVDVSPQPVDTHSGNQSSGNTAGQNPQSPGTILIIVGDPGTRGASGINHNVGKNFDRVAATKKKELEAQGYSVIVQRASSFEDFKNALTSNGMLDGVEYVGHSSNIMLYVGEQAAPGTNVDHSNIPQLSNANLNKNAYIKLNGCNVGAGGHNSMGQWLSNRLDRTVIAFDGPSRFYGSPSASPGSGGRRPPSSGPLYLLEEKGTNMVIVRPW